MLRPRSVLCLLLALQLAAGINIRYDETRWAKRDWHKWKVAYEPLKVTSPDVPAELRDIIAKSKYNSMDGPTSISLTQRQG